MTRIRGGFNEDLLQEVGGIVTPITNLNVDFQFANVSTKSERDIYTFTDTWRILQVGFVVYTNDWSKLETSKLKIYVGSDVWEIQLRSLILASGQLNSFFAADTRYYFGLGRTPAGLTFVYNDSASGYWYYGFRLQIPFDVSSGDKIAFYNDSDTAVPTVYVAVVYGKSVSPV